MTQSLRRRARGTGMGSGKKPGKAALIIPGGHGEKKEGENPARAPEAQPDPAPDRVHAPVHTAITEQSDAALNKQFKNITHRSASAEPPLLGLTLLKH